MVWIYFFSDFRFQYRTLIKFVFAKNEKIFDFIDHKKFLHNNNINIIFITFIFCFLLLWRLGIGPNPQSPFFQFKNK